MLVSGRRGTATEKATAMAETGLLGRTIPEEAGMGRKVAGMGDRRSMRGCGPRDHVGSNGSL